MQTRLVALILTLSIGLLGGCTSGGSEADPPSGSTSPSSSESVDSEPVPALRLRGHLGKFTYCLNVGSDPEDYLWSGTWLAAHEDATISAVTPGTIRNLKVVGTWVVEDERDDGEIGPWSEVSGRVKGDLVPLQDAQLAGGSSYRVVLRLRPTGQLPSEMTGLAVDYSSQGEDGTVTDESILRLGTSC